MPYTYTYTTVQCARCLRYVPPDQATQPTLDLFPPHVYADSVLCPECVIRETTCAVCSDRLEPTDTLTRVTIDGNAEWNGGYACPRCTPDLFECPYHSRLGCPAFELPDRHCEPTGECWQCDGPIWDYQHITDHAGDHYCLDCARDYLTFCGACGDYYPDDDVTDGRCSDCGPEDEYDDEYDDEYGDVTTVHGYSYRPAPQFKGDGPVYLGWELELSDREESGAAVVAEYADESLVYLKDDCSIRGYGFELVTHPMSYAWAMESFPWQMIRALSNAGCSGSGNGLHVHVSRAGFSSRAHLYRWLKFIYRNESAVTAIARRNSGEWAPFNERERQADIVKGKTRPYGRYSAVNLTNEHTVEVRVFASTVNANKIKAALALVAASVEYTRNLTVPTILSGGWTWSAFMEWTDSHPEYAPLSAEWTRLSAR